MSKMDINVILIHCFYRIEKTYKKGQQIRLKLLVQQLLLKHSAAQSKWINEGKTHVIFNHGDPNSKGVLILFPHNIDYNS